MKVIPIINKSLEQDTPRRPKRKRSYFYISESGKKPYEIFKNLTQNKRVFPRLQRAFDNGNDVHKRITKYLLKQGVVRGVEVKIKTKLLHGRADAIIFSDGKVAVLEIKSMNKSKFENLKHYCDSQTYLQIQLYMNFLKINDGIILAECKNDQRLKEFHIKRKPRVAKEQITFFTKLKNKFVQAGVMAA